MFWLIPILLSFDIIEALVPVIIILVLIAAAAGLTRGMDMFALFGLGSLMGFANSGSGRVGKGLRGTRYGADAVRRGRAASKANGGVLKKVKGIRKNIKARNSLEARAARKQSRDRRQAGRARHAAFLARRFANLQKNGKGDSLRAQLIKKDLAHIREQTTKNYKTNLREADIAKATNQVLSGKNMAGAAAGGIMLSTRSHQRIEKTKGKIDKISQEKDQKTKDSNSKKLQFAQANKATFANMGFDVNKIFSHTYDKQQRDAEVRKMFEQGSARKTRLASASENGIRIGKVPTFNYVKNLKSASGKDVNVLTIPKSAFVQKGATTAIGVAILQKHWQKKALGTGKAADNALKNLNKLNDYVAKGYYGTGSAANAFEKNKKGELHSSSAKKLKNVVNFDIPVPFSHTVSKLIGKRFEEEKIVRLPGEDYDQYRTRVKDIKEIEKMEQVNKSHTIRHPIAGVHGTNALQKKINELNNSVYNEVKKNAPPRKKY
jgi:hypothetical protein